METNSLFPLRYRIRKTDELVEIVAWETADKGTRSDSDWVSYIDASGAEHIKEHLTLEWDFVIQTPFEKGFLDALKPDMPTFDPWESRRYELVKEMYFDDNFWVKRNIKGIDDLVKIADAIISALKKSHDAEEEPKKGLD